MISGVWVKEPFLPPCSSMTPAQDCSCARQRSMASPHGLVTLSQSSKMGEELSINQLQFISLNFQSWQNTPLIFEFLFPRSQYDGPEYIQRKRKHLENKKSSLREKEAVIKEVKENDNHDFLSFFVCRNPVAHMLSVYNHLKKFVETGAWERFHGAKHRQGWCG